MAATHRTKPQVQAGLGLLGLVTELIDEMLPGRPEAAPIGTLGKTKDVTVEIA